MAAHPRKKILILVPDGVSLRNFAYTQFHQLGNQQGYDLTFWNATPFDLSALGFSEIKIDRPKAHPKTDLIKTARIRAELNLYSKRDLDPIYQQYKFPLSKRNFKARLKSGIVRWLMFWNGSERGVERLRLKMQQQERSTTHYKTYLETLKKFQPDVVFCASQRTVTAIAPLTAAQDLGIPTATFIFSWDNVPKATTVISSDYYLVWSEHMKKELLHYQRYLTAEQVLVCGTPQFEPHFDEKRLLSRSDFYQQHGLHPENRYVCFSGDDITTSPKDERYLEDVAAAIRSLQSDDPNLRLLFRRCPVDFSDRYDAVLDAYSDVLIPIDPLWQKIGAGWNTILPTEEDLNLQTNLIAHTEAVVNLGSSMVFDYAAHGKPCAFMNYNYLKPQGHLEPGVHVYDFVHFRSMPSPHAVQWLSDPADIARDLTEMLNHPERFVKPAQDWFKIINLHPPGEASQRIWEALEKIGSTP